LTLLLSYLLLQGAGGRDLERAKPLLNFPYPPRSGVFKRGASPSKNYVPLPLIKGKGIKGIGLINIGQIDTYQEYH
jgi:hypothetical protein